MISDLGFLYDADAEIKKKMKNEKENPFYFEALAHTDTNRIRFFLLLC